LVTEQGVGSQKKREIREKDVSTMGKEKNYDAVKEKGT